MLTECSEAGYFLIDISGNMIVEYECKGKYFLNIKTLITTLNSLVGKILL